MGTQVELVRSVHDLSALQDEWRALTSRNPDVAIFLTWEWVNTLRKHFGQNREPWVLIARNDAGELIGIAPWTIVSKKLGPIKIRRVEFLSRIELPNRTEPIDYGYLNIITSPDESEAVTEAFVQYLDRTGDQWDVGDFAWVPENSTLRTQLTRRGQLKSVRVDVSPVIQLPGDWDTYAETVLGRNRTTDLRQNARRLERDYPGQVVYEQVTDRDKVRPGIDRIIEMNEARWLTLGRPTGFEFEQFAEFHRDIATVAFDHGWLRLFQLRVADQIIAAGCRFLYAGRYYAFLKGFDQNWKKYSPGLILQAHEIRQAISEGAHEYDMAHGTVEPKRIWTRTERREVQVLKGHNWKGALYLGQTIGFYRAKTVARRVLPPSVFKRIRQQFLGRGTPMPRKPA